MKPSEVVVLLDKLTRRRVPLFIWGPPGIGKSSIVKDVARRNRLDFLDLRLSLLDPTDLKGIPFFDPQTKQGVWAPAGFLPNEPDSKGILFLDEINTAPPAVQASAYQLILDRKVGEYELPEGWSIVAAGNRENDRGVVYKMPPPLANRFVHVEMEVDFEDWKRWAYEANIDPSIIAFLAYDQERLFDFDPQKQEKAFATPRSWSYVDTLVKSDIKEHLLYETIGGAVGKDAATAYMDFKKVMHDLPDLDAIVQGKTTETEEDNPRVLTALVIGLANKLKQHRDSQHAIDSVIRYSMSLPGEFAIMLIKELQHAHIDVESSTLWDDWVAQYAYLLS